MKISVGSLSTAYSQPDSVIPGGSEGFAVVCTTKKIPPTSEWTKRGIVTRQSITAMPSCRCD